MSARILIHVQHLVGIGHLHRMAVLARALAARGAAVQCVSGGMPVPGLDLGLAKLIQLPPARARDLSYKQLVDDAGTVVTNQWRAARCEQLLGALDRFVPDIVITETFPFGRRLLRFELEPLLQWVAVRPHVRLVASIRDILEGYAQPSARVDQAIADVQQFYASVMVHSDPNWVALDASFAGVAFIANKIHYTGFVTDVATAAPRCSTLRTGVLVSTGGGAVALELAQACVIAARDDPYAREWRLLLGHNLAQSQFDGVCSRASPNLTVERNRSDFDLLLAGAAVSISQAGYNTVAEVLATRTPAVLVPFAAAGQREQTHRAAALARTGRVEVVLAEELTGAALLNAVQRACERSPDAQTAALDGAQQAANWLLDVARVS